MTELHDKVYYIITLTMINTSNLKHVNLLLKGVKFHEPRNPHFKRIKPIMIMNQTLSKVIFHNSRCRTPMLTKHDHELQTTSRFRHVS